MMKRIVLIAAVAAAATAAGTGGWYWFSRGRFIESTDDATISSDIVAVAPKVPGRIAAVPVADNQQVRAGEVLLRLDDSDARAAAAEAEAALAAAEAAVRVIDVNVEVARHDVDEAVAARNGAEAERERSAADLVRYRTLNQSQYASAQKYQTSLADARKAQAAVAQSVAALASRQGRLRLLAAQREQAAATVEQTRAALASARIRLADTVVHAPIDGIVGNREAQAGQYIQAGQQAMSVVPASVFVVANFKETQLAHMAQGQPVTVTVDTYGSRKFAGVVDSLSPGSGAVFSLLPPENATGNFTKIVQRIPVKIRLKDRDDGILLVPGMSVVARVDTRGNAERSFLSDRRAFNPAATSEPRAASRGRP